MRLNYLIFGILLFGCTGKHTSTSDESIVIHYMRPYVSTPFSYPCGMISKEVLKDDIHIKEFSDSIVIKEFLDIYKKYERDVELEGGIDTRIKVIINTKNINDTLCLAENFTSVINGKKVKHNKEMLDYIKMLIDYENTPRPKFPKVNN